MKIKHFLLITIVLSFSVAIAYRNQFIYYMDQAITDATQATIYRTNAIIAAVLTILIGAVYVLFLYTDKAKEADGQRLSVEPNPKENFDREIHNISSKLLLMGKDNEYERFFHIVDITTKQINILVKYNNKFNKLYIGTSVDVFAGVSGSLDVAKDQFIQNSKSILNRIIIEDSDDGIDKRIANNNKIIEDVKSLLYETVYYLDNKTNSYNSQLENIITSLKTLNETI